MSAPAWVGVALLGGVGAAARFLVDGAISERVSSALPWGTLAVNVSGSAALGALVGASLHGDALTLAGTATIGSYTTFSTWMFETHRLAEQGQRRAAALNVVVSLAAGLAAAAIARALAG